MAASQPQQPRASSRKTATGKSKGKQPAGISKSTETTAPTVKHTVHGRFQKEAEEHLARQNGQNEVDDSVMDMDSNDEDSTLRNKSLPPPKVRKTKRAPTLKQYITSKDKSEDVQLSLQDTIVHVPALRDLLYKSLPAQVAESIRPEMEEMERRRKEKSDERKRKAVERQGLSTITEEVGIMSIQHEKELTSQMAMEIDKDNSRTRVSARSPIVMTRIKNLEIKALCDTGAEVNVMSKVVAKQCGLAINSIS
ncbi:hypothetical protein EG327_000603 [Venturia inaequalis]|uniref:Uncharacterized protein n=1 Tax=Venturia inaequalis TaxID=5025 RepID=A0A8H3YP61_VENIN|nr:hypothetical protein EG327_000603 [Venturia inaequalis]